MIEVMKGFAEQFKKIVEILENIAFILKRHEERIKKLEGK